MLQIIHFLFFFDKYVCLKFDASNTVLKKKLGQGPVFHRVASSLLSATLSNRLGTEMTHCCFDSDFFLACHRIVNVILSHHNTSIVFITSQTQGVSIRHMKD